MKNYYRIMLGRGSAFAEDAFKGGYVGAGFLYDVDLTGRLSDDWREFNRQCVPLWLERNPGKSRVAAGLACGALWTITKGMKRGDVVLCPNGRGSYGVGEVVDDYAYHPDADLPHRRTVRWLPNTIDRAQMSEALRNSTGSIGTISDVSKHAGEIERLIQGHGGAVITSSDDTIEDVSVFALEKHLEDFLVKNWAQTELGKHYDIFEEDGELIGQQYQTDTGAIDILAISKDKKELLVIELKKGRASDVVVGQIQRYMGYVLEELLTPGQVVKGVIIALEDDIRLKRALSVASNIGFYRYQVSFRLFKG